MASKVMEPQFTHRVGDRNPPLAFADATGGVSSGTKLLLRHTLHCHFSATDIQTQFTAVSTTLDVAKVFFYPEYAALLDCR